MANAIFEPEQAWRFCDICDPHETRPFSAERAYIKHQTSQRHLKKAGQPLQDVSCPKCGKSLSRGSIVLRHLASGQCPGRRPTSDSISEPSKKHALSVSPNGIVRKIQKTAAFDFEKGPNGGTSPHTSAARSKDAVVTNPAAHVDERGIAQGSADNACSSLSKLVSLYSRPSSDTSSNPARTDDSALPFSHSSKGSGASTIHHDDMRETPATSLSDSLLSALANTSPYKQTLRSSLTIHLQEDRLDGADDTNNDSRVIHKERQPSSSRSEDTPITSTVAPDEGKGTEDQWLSNAMESASLNENNLSYSPMQGIFSGTPADSVNSLGSLFLLRTPRTDLNGWNRLPSFKISSLGRSSLRSVEMPTPLLSGPVDEELRMSRSLKYQPTVIKPIRTPAPYNRDPNESLIDRISWGDLHYWWMYEFYCFDINYRSRSRNNSTALMVACMRGDIVWAYELIKMGFRVGSWPVLSMQDDGGKTILDLAAHAGNSSPLKKILRVFAVLTCCECAENIHRNSVCGVIARQGFLEEGEEPEATDPGCRWGEKLRCLEWPTNDALKDIDDRTRVVIANESNHVRLQKGAMWIQQ